MAKYDFKNDKVNSFYQNLEHSSFISKDFILNLGAIYLTAMRIEGRDEKRKFFTDYVEDVKRISIFSEKFQIELTDILDLILWPNDDVLI